MAIGSTKKIENSACETEYLASVMVDEECGSASFLSPDIGISVQLLSQFVCQTAGCALRKPTLLVQQGEYTNRLLQSIVSLDR